MTCKQIKREMTAVGLTHLKTLDFLARQHLMIFTLPRPGTGSNPAE